MTKKDKVKSVGEIFHKDLVPEDDQDRNPTWSLCHRVISSSRNMRTKNYNSLLRRIEKETVQIEGAGASAGLDQDDMDAIAEVIAKGIAVIDASGAKVRGSIEELNKFASHCLQVTEIW